MIQIENIQVVGLEAAIRGMRNPMNSWEKSDSEFDVDCVICTNSNYDCETCPCSCSTFGMEHTLVGPNDYDLMMRLAKQGAVHGKFRRMIEAYMDITAPLYWWKEFDTYKVGTVANSCSTMHKIHAKEFTLDDFSHEHLIDYRVERDRADADPNYSLDECRTLIGSDPHEDPYIYPEQFLIVTCSLLNAARKLYLQTKDKKYWWQMIQLLPSSYNQRRTVMLSYEVLANIYQYRHNHKLDEWREFCTMIEGLPYSEIITCGCEAT